MPTINPVMHSVITPFIKHMNGVQVILWDYSFRASMYKSFLCMTDDYAEYVPIRFEAL